jgi:hypothetical protein
MNIIKYNFINLNFNVETRNKVSSRGSQTASQLAKLHLLQFYHSRLDPWFDWPFDSSTYTTGTDARGGSYIIDGIELIVVRNEDFY